MKQKVINFLRKILLFLLPYPMNKRKEKLVDQALRSFSELYFTKKSYPFVAILVVAVVFMCFGYLPVWGFVLILVFCFCMFIAVLLYLYKKHREATYKHKLNAKKELDNIFDYKDTIGMPYSSICNTTALIKAFRKDGDKENLYINIFRYTMQKDDNGLATNEKTGGIIRRIRYKDGGEFTAENSAFISLLIDKQGAENLEEKWHSLEEYEVIIKEDVTEYFYVYDLHSIRCPAGKGKKGYNVVSKNTF